MEKIKAKKGKVMQVFPKAEKVLVEGVNVVTKHQKPSKDHPQGGLIKKGISYSLFKRDAV